MLSNEYKYGNIDCAAFVYTLKFLNMGAASKLISNHSIVYHHHEVTATTRLRWVLCVSMYSLYPPFSVLLKHCSTEERTKLNRPVGTPGRI